MQDLFPGSSFDTGIGDYVAAEAPGGNAATQWHQDRHLPRHVICATILTAEIGDSDAPMLIAANDHVIKVTGPKGMVLLRDVSIWHKGTAHSGDMDRRMASYLFCTVAAQELGCGVSKRLNRRTADKFPPVIKSFLSKRTRPGTASFAMMTQESTLSSDHNQAEAFQRPAQEQPYSVFCPSCFIFLTQKKEDKEKRDDKKSHKKADDKKKAEDKKTQDDKQLPRQLIYFRMRDDLVPEFPIVQGTVDHLRANSCGSERTFAYCVFSSHRAVFVFAPRV